MELKVCTTCRSPRIYEEVMVSVNGYDHMRMGVYHCMQCEKETTIATAHYAVPDEEGSGDGGPYFVETEQDAVLQLQHPGVEVSDGLHTP